MFNKIFHKSSEKKNQDEVKGYCIFDNDMHLRMKCKTKADAEANLLLLFGRFKNWSIKESYI